MPTCPICGNPLKRNEALIFDGNVLWHEVAVEDEGYSTRSGDIRRVWTAAPWCGRNIRVAPIAGVEVPA